MLPGELLHVPHGGDRVPGPPLPHGPGHAVHAEVIEHPPVSAGHHLVWAGRPELAPVLAVVIDAARVDQDGVRVKQVVAGVNLLLQLVNGENNILDT